MIIKIFSLLVKSWLFLRATSTADTQNGTGVLSLAPVYTSFPISPLPVVPGPHPAWILLNPQTPTLHGERYRIQTPKLCFLSPRARFSPQLPLVLSALSVSFPFCFCFASSLVSFFLCLFFLSISDIKLANTVRNLGVFLDPTLSFQQQISSVCHICYLELRRVNVICHYLSEDVTKNLVCAFILSRLDYCNLFLAGCPKYLFLNSKGYRTMLQD